MKQMRNINRNVWFDAGNYLWHFPWVLHFIGYRTLSFRLKSWWFSLKVLLWRFVFTYHIDTVKMIQINATKKIGLTKQKVWNKNQMKLKCHFSFSIMMTLLTTECEWISSTTVAYFFRFCCWGNSLTVDATLLLLFCSSISNITTCQLANWFDK